ncbi:uncharacterized protein E0L32_009461 [Thyridium curvatum]|uniref:Bacteriophage T5 Orf172 DNA-binding domain-containing protein n=1 Tax=Thyridium curvatum TaxID=1093900 RepID=A0A507APU3_9PEZI|nr:uncharacterized protein E0L32_009461 [Thyridium curvatum]TPX09417.1 hypothetical protein E0L32_009461 [Thyridium curvatum]
MPFIANTPESLLGRSDSKNPSTTCRGITSSGRPCRRPLASSPESTPPRSRFGRSNGSSLRADDPSDESLYCWQHKEQASLSARSSPGPRSSVTPILEEPRTSIDTLADRLGLLDVSPEKRRQSRKHSGYGATATARPPAQMTRPKPKHHVTFCFCFRMPVEEVSPPPRPKPTPVQQPQMAMRPGAAKMPAHLTSHSATSQYLSLIPPGAAPQTASLLLAELAKPVSQLDEPGYIYMFWLTPESQPATPPADAARSLLAPPSSRPSGQRRTSDVLASFAANTGPAPRGGGGQQTKKVLLKIGRATNVQRRLNEWKRQCGYNLSLIRYYPYIPSSPSPSPTPSPSRGRHNSSDAAPGIPRKVPHSHKVERLIHIELAGLGLRVADREACEACGREHREWFEVEASRRGVVVVDEVVRRWVGWDEGAEAVKRKPR